MSVSDSDIYYCYNNIWKRAKERENAHFQGIDITQLIKNVNGLRVGYARAQFADTAISEAYGNRRYIPLD